MSQPGPRGGRRYVQIILPTTLTLLLIRKTTLGLSYDKLSTEFGASAGHLCAILNEFTDYIYENDDWLTASRNLSNAG